MQRLRLGFFLVSLMLLLTACPDPTTGVTPPGTVKAKAQAGKIVVSWNDSAAVDGFNVYRYEGEDKNKLNTDLLTSSPYEDTAVTEGVSYEYVVTAVKDSVESGESTKTDPVEPGPVDSTAPSVTLTASDTSLPSDGGIVTLTADVTPGGAAITNVEFFKGTTSLGTDSTSPYTLANVNVTETSTFKAVATDSADKTDEDTVEVKVESGGNTSCDAKAATYTAVVNTPLIRGPRSLSTVKAALVNNTALVAESCIGVLLVGSNSNVDLNDDGTFVYTPDRNSTTQDSFQYSSNGKTATVTIEVLDADGIKAGPNNIVYVDKSATGGTGTATTPYNEIALAESNSEAGDTIYLFNGSYTGTVSMKADQKVIGQGIAFEVNDLTLVEAGTSPKITADQYGFELGAGGSSGTYINVGNLEIKGLTIQNITGGPTGDAPGSGIKSDNLQGTLLVEDVTISGVTGHGMYIDHNNHDKPVKHEITIRNVTITNPGQYGIWVDDPTNLLIEDSQITGVKGGVTYGSIGIDAQDEFGNHGTDKPVTIRNVSISGNAGTTGIRFIKNNKCRANVNDNEQNCNNVTKENSTVVIQNITTTTPTGIIMQTQTGEEDKMESGFLSHFEYFGDQGDVELNFSGTAVSCVKSIFEFDNSTPAQVTEAKNKITSTGITCN